MKTSIKQKIMGFFIGMTLIVLVISTAVLYVTLNSSERNRASEEIDKIMQEKLYKFNDIISTINTCGNYVRYDDELINTINSVPSNEYEKNKITEKILADINSIYKMNLDSKLNTYSTVFFMNEKLPTSELLLDGSVCKLESTNSDMRMYTTKGLAGAWIDETLKKNGLMYMFIDEDVGQLYFTQMIRNELYIADQNEYVGIMLIKIDLLELLSEFQKIGGYSASAAIIYDDRVVFKTDDADNELFVSESNEGYINKRVKSDIGLEFVSRIEKSQFGMQTEDLRNIFGIYIVIALIVAVILSIVMSRSLTKPITTLARLMNNIKNTEIKNLHIQKQSYDEVGELYDAFNYMTDTISELIEKNKEEAEKRYELEFKLYQHRINPHMLYNTLDTISWMALMDGNDKIVNMNSLLSEIYRYSVKHRDSMATLYEELECVEKYIKLQQLRSDYSIILDIEEGDCGNIIVPQFILQPLVENSIVHGYTESMKELIIKIKLNRSNEIIKIMIEDNGKGCNVDELNEHLKSEADNTKIGMRNVNARIKLKFGNEYGLEAENGESGGTRIIITLPSGESDKNLNREEFN